MAVKYKLSNNTIVIDNGYSLDLYVGKTKVHLYPQSQKILRLLIEAGLHDWKVTREKMYECLWGEYQGTEKNCNDTIRGCIRQLRRALGKETIQSEYGVGYYLQESPELISESVIGNNANSIVQKDAEETIETPCNTKNALSFSMNYTFYVNDLLERVTQVNQELEELFDAYEHTQEMITREISECEKSRVLAGAYLISMMKLSSQMEEQFRKMQDLCDERNECEKMTQYLIESNQFINQPINMDKPHSTATVININDHLRVEERTRIVRAKIVEVKNRIDEIYNDFDYHQSRKNELFGNMNL